MSHFHEMLYELYGIIIIIIISSVENTILKKGLKITLRKFVSVS